MFMRIVSVEVRIYSAKAMLQQRDVYRLSGTAARDLSNDLLLRALGLAVEAQEAYSRGAVYAVVRMRYLA